MQKNWWLWPAALTVAMIGTGIWTIFKMTGFGVATIEGLGSYWTGVASMAIIVRGMQKN